MSQTPWFAFGQTTRSVTDLVCHEHIIYWATLNKLSNKQSVEQPTKPNQKNLRLPGHFPLSSLGSHFCCSSSHALLRWRHALAALLGALRTSLRGFAKAFRNLCWGLRGNCGDGPRPGGWCLFECACLFAAGVLWCFIRRSSVDIYSCRLWFDLKKSAHSKNERLTQLTNCWVRVRTPTSQIGTPKARVRTPRIIGSK